MVKKIIGEKLRNGGDLFFSQQRTILSGAVVIGSMLLASTALGIIKYRLYASVVAPDGTLDAFFAADRIPTFIFQLLIAGSLNAAFIPLFSHYIETHSRESAWRFVSSVLNLTLLIFLLLVGISFVFARQIAGLVAPGFASAQKDLLIRLIRILLLAPTLLGISSFIAGTLQSFKRFFLPFFSPVLYNLGAIFGVLFLYPVLGIEGAAWGVVVGAAAHLLIQLPALRHIGFNYRVLLDLKDQHLRKMFKLSIPRTVGAGAEQIKTFVMTSLASLLPSGSISFYQLGQTVTNVPVSIIGVSIAQASLPQFSSLHAQKDLAALKRTFKSSFDQILFFIMPATVLLVVLKIPAVRLLYGAGKFDWEDTVLTAWVVAFLGIAMFARALNTLMVRFYYALQETKLPVGFSVVSMIVSIVVAAGLIWWLPVLGVKAVAIGVSIGALVELVFLGVSLFRKEIIDEGFLNTPIKIIFSSIMMAISVWVPVKLLDQVFIDTSRVINLVILVWLVTSFGATVYLLLTWILGVRELRVVFRLLLKMRKFREGIEEFIMSPQVFSSPTILQDDGDSLD